MSARTVLLVEDDADIRDLIEQTLRRSSVELHTVANGEDALSHLRSGPVDLLILDIGLPGIDGWEVLQIVRDTPALAELPTLVVSVLDPDDRRPQTNVTYLAKPFRPAELARVVGELLPREPEGSP